MKLTLVKEDKLPKHTAVMKFINESVRMDYEVQLSPSEYLLYGKKHSDKKIEWLSGRIAAKKAVQCALLEEWGMRSDMKMIEILYKPTGALEVRSDTILVDGISLQESVKVSISHSCGMVAAQAAAITKAKAIGVDIEQVRNFDDSLMRSFMTIEEYKKCNCMPLPEQSVFATRLWCMKEAYLKAKEKGLRIHPGKIEVGLGHSPATITEDGVVTSVIASWTTISKSYILASIQI